MRGPLFAGLLDDAAIFPPGNAPMPAAVAAQIGYADQWYADLVGPFVCTAARLDELSAVLAEQRDVLGFGLSVLAPVDEVASVLDRVAAQPPLRIDALELARVGTAEQAQRAIAAAPREVTTYVELAWAAEQDGVLDVLGGTRVGAKLRTGGTEAFAFPTEEHLGAAIVGCVRRLIPFKCTAGLHHAVRHTDAVTGFEHHGFLNVLAAVAAAQDGAGIRDVATILAGRSAEDLAADLAAWDEARATTVRTAFRSFGTCSIIEPVEDLVAIGLLPERSSAV
ncbi:MAG TPA: hypothetical protein VH561_18900 [Micromonosporaceae bacterium]|jgi:hypothetical protein